MQIYDLMLVAQKWTI